MKVYRILVSSGGELPEIVLSAAARPPSALPRLFPVLKKLSTYQIWLSTKTA